jgi:hypothetical protein
MKHLMIWAALVAAPAWGQTCTIVTNGEVSTYQHEVAHCNGWTHPPFQEATPPASFVHPFAGELTIYFGSGGDIGDEMDTINTAPMKTHYVFEDKTVQAICQWLWRKNGIAAASDKMDQLVGCSVLHRAP